MNLGGPHTGARRVAAAWVTSALVLLCGCAEQRIRDSAQTQARTGDYEHALATLDDGLKAYPDSAVLRAGLIETRLDAQTRLIREAATARAEGRLDEAENLLGRASTVQPGNARVSTMLNEVAIERRQRAALTEAESLVNQRKPVAALALINDALKSNPRQPDLLALQRKLELAQRQSQIRSAQTGLSELRPISIDFRDANLRTVLDVLSRNSGINFILDKDIRPDVRVTVFLRGAKVEDAIDLITSTNQLAKKVVDSKTLLIYPNTPEKRAEHQEQVVRVFYLASGDAKGAASFLKSMLKLREPYIDERTNMLALRDSQENIQLAERLIALYDTPEPEVLLEVEVIEINTTRLTDLGVKLPDSFSLTLLPPIGSDSLNLANVRGLTRDRIGLSIGGVTVNLKRETGDFTTLASPRIRVKNKEKAKILVGDKIPIVSATTGSTGFVADSISYLDVGLKLDVEPTIYIDDEVAIKVTLEVSTLGNQVKTASGSLAYQIGTRNATTLLRLRDGETQLLAGLISKQDSSSASRVPGLGDLPTVGRLFSSTLDNSQNTELVLSITPRILRNQRRPDVNESELWVGTDAAPRLRPVGGVVAAIESTGSSVQTQGAAGAPGGSTIGAESSQSQASAGPVVRWDGPSQAKVGETFSVALELQSDQPLRGVPVQFTYPKERLELIDIEEGEFFKQGNAQTSFTRTIDAANGRGSTGVLRNTSTGAVGKGKVVTLKFKAAAAGVAEVSLFGMNPVGLSGAVSPPASLPILRLQVQ